jgi:hypothetical protein
VQPVLGGGLDNDLARIYKSVRSFQGGEGAGDDFVLAGRGFGVEHLEGDTGSLEPISDFFEDEGFDGACEETGGRGPVVDVDWLDRVG